MRFSDEEKAVVERLIPYSDRKGFVAELLINGYNSSVCKTDVATLMRYDLGEPPGSTYVEDIFTFLRVISRGVETHEIVGQEAMDKIMAGYFCYHCSECDKNFCKSELEMGSEAEWLCPDCSGLVDYN